MFCHFCLFFPVFQKQKHHVAAAQEGEPVVCIQGILPYAGSQVVIEHERAAAYVREKGHQDENERRAFRGLVHVDLYDYRDVDYCEQKRADYA
jgi:hypothetical protein